MTLDLTSLEKSIHAFQAIYARAEDKPFMDMQDEITRNAMRSGVIQQQYEIVQ